MARPAAGFLVVLTALVALPLQAQAQTEVWSGTLTVRDLGFSLLGCSNTVATSNCSSRLTDDDFTHDSTDYAITIIFLRTNGQLEIEFDTDLTTATQGLELHVDGTAFAFEDADSKLAAVRVWFNSGLSWSAGDSVSLTLIEPADATLSDLVLEDNAGTEITLTPTFVTGTTRYTASVASSVSAITLTPTVNDASATVEYLNASNAAITDTDTTTDALDAPLVVGANTFKVKVTAGNTTPTTKTYRVVVTRAADTTAPSLVRAEVLVAGNSVSVTFDEALDIATEFLPAAVVSAFTLTADGVELAIHTIGGSGSGVLAIRLPTGTVISQNQTVKLSYNKTTAGTDALEDAAANEVATFTDFAVTNNSTVVPTNTPAEGKPTISGPAQVGRTLTAATAGITDDEGLTMVSYEYEWLAAGTVIGGATSATYTPTSSVQGDKIAVRVTFDDDEDNPETLTSDETAPVVPDAVFCLGTAVWCSTLTVEHGTPDEEGEFVVGLATNSGTPPESFGSLVGATFTHLGTSYTVTQILASTDLVFATSPNLPDDGAGLTLHIQRISGTLALKLSDRDTYNVSSSFPTGTKLWYFHAAPGTGPANPPLLRGYIPANGDYRQDTDEGTLLTVSLFHENRAAEGTPTISGTAQVGETLTAGMGDIADDEGLTSTFPDDYTFQWLRVDADGMSNETPIGADAVTYTPVAADVGKKIKVRVNFTDDGGTGETLTSDAYPSSGTITAGTLPALSFAGSNITVNETAGTATLTVELDPASTGTVTVDYATSDQTAQAGVDYTATSGTLTFAASETSKTITVPILNDTDYDPSQRFRVTLSNAPGATLPTSPWAFVNITNDDAVPTASIANVTVGEGAGTLTLTLALDRLSNRDISYSAVTAGVGGTATVADDYVSFLQGGSKDFTVPAGAMSATFDITLVDDSLDETDETIVIVWTKFLSHDATPASITVTGTITDNDTAGNNPPVFDDGEDTSRAFNETLGDVAVITASDIGTAVGATDSNNDTLAYSLEGADAARFGIITTTGQLRTRAGEKYDFEAQPSYAVTVRVVDGNGGADTVTVTITVTDVAEPPRAPAAPTVTATPNTTDSLSVSWRAPSNTGRPAIDDYDLQYREGTTGSWADGPQNQTGTSATITGLTAAPAAYQVQVRATNAEGDGLWSPPGRIGGGGGGGGRNDPPLAVDDAGETVEGTPVFIDVLANDSDPDGDPLTVVEVSAPAHGTAVVAAAGTVEYTPEPDFHGTDRFTYVVGDGSGLTAQAAVDVTVLPVNDPPLAGDDAADTPEDTSVTIAVLANDSDPDGDALALVEASAPAHGSARLTDAGAVEYTPEPDFHGADRFTYVVGDGSGLTARAAVDVTVLPVNDPPLATGVIPDQTLDVGDGPASLDLIPFFEDRDGDALGYTAVVSDQAVAVSLTGATLTLTATRPGTATVTVTAQDPGGLTATQAFLVTTTDHQARGVVEDTLAALGRGHLASARATLGRRVETTGQEQSQVTVAGLHVPLGTGVAAAGRAVAERWITGLAGGMPLGAGGRSGPGAGAVPGAFGVAGAPGAMGSPAGALGLAAGGVSSTLSSLSPLSAGGQTDFLLALGRGQAGGGTAQGPRWTVWGQIDQQAFGGERSPAARYDGYLQTAYVGVDARLSERWLAGVAVARSRGNGDWTFGSSTGRLTTTLTSVQPYLRWSDGGTTIWATAGGGSGTAENERVRYGLQEESALGLRLGLVEVRRRLATVGGGVELQLRGDASWARLTTAAGDELIDALEVDVHQLRVGIDVSRPVLTADGTLVEPFGEVHARRDGGSGQTGAGLEVAGGLRVARGVFRVEGMGRLLALHAADGYREHGGAVTLSVGDGARQPGLTLSLSPRWGAPATASDALWQEELYGQATGGTGADERALDARVDYGLTLPAGGLLTPFGVYGQSPYGRRLRVGLLINRLGPIGLEVSGERTPSRDPGGGVYRVSVRGSITFGGADPASASPDAGQ